MVKVYIYMASQRWTKAVQGQRTKEGAHITCPQIDLKGMAANRKGKRTTNNIGKIKSTYRREQNCAFLSDNI